MAELIAALDFPAEEEAFACAGKIQGIVPWVKVGLELFTANGPRLIRGLKEMGFRVFLDLKFHDIPNTVRGAVASAAGIGADILTLHIAGGRKMCGAALSASLEFPKPPLLFGVTALTSLSEGDIPGYSGSIEEYALNLARAAAESGLAGVVCSGFEVRKIKALCPGLMCITPGIRMEGNGKDDQSRIATPEFAVREGSDFLVVGRPITRAADPAAAAAAILERMNA